MVFNIKNTANKKVKVFDAQGNQILTAFEYNSKTKEIGMYLKGKRPNKVLMRSGTSKNKWEIVKINVKIPGSYIVVDGKTF